MNILGGGDGNSLTNGPTSTDSTPTAHELTVELREALGLFAGAMACSPKQAWAEAIELVKRNRAALSAPAQDAQAARVPDLVPLEVHYRMTTGPAPWTDTRVVQEPFHTALAVFGSSSHQDDQRVYRTLQAYEWRRAASTQPATPPHPEVPKLTRGELHDAYLRSSGLTKTAYFGKSLENYGREIEKMVRQQLGAPT